MLHLLLLFFVEVLRYLYVLSFVSMKLYFVIIVKDANTMNLFFVLNLESFFSFNIIQIQYILIH